MDGAILKGFGYSRIYNGITKQMDISVLPALLVVNPQQKTATPVAYGFVSLDQIEEKIILQFKE